MSINSLTDAEVRRRTRRRSVPRRDASPSETALIPEDQQGGGGEGSEGDNEATVSNALSMLVKYIPTESITLYVAALSAAPALKTFSQQRINEYSIYFFFGALTPILFALILLGKRRAAQDRPLASVKNWPWWKHVAATVAFFVWALAVPGNPFVKGVEAGAVAGFFAIFISTVLSILEQIFDNQNSPANP